MIGQILATLLPVFLIAGSGAAYGRFRTPDIRSLNTLNMELFVPLLVFAVLADRQAPLAEYAWLASAAALVVSTTHGFVPQPHQSRRDSVAFSASTRTPFSRRM